MQFTGSWLWYVSISMRIVHINHRPLFHLKRDASKIEFCLRVQVVTTQLSPTHRTNLSLLTPATIPISHIKPTTKNGVMKAYISALWVCTHALFHGKYCWKLNKVKIKIFTKYTNFPAYNHKFKFIDTSHIQRKLFLNIGNGIWTPLFT
jgi:hypothetical protein